MTLIGAAVGAFDLGAGPVRSDGSVAFAGCRISSLLSCRRVPGILPRRGTGLLLRAAWILRVGGGGRRRASGRRRSAASKANVLSPLVAVVKTICHSNRLASRITYLSYKKDVQQMGACAKSSVNGTNGSEPGAIRRRPPRVIESRHQNGRSQRVAPLTVRPKNGAARFAVLPSVESQAALLCQGRILKPRNKSARQNGLRKG